MSWGLPRFPHKDQDMSLGEEIASLESGSTYIQHSGSKCTWYAYALESQKEEKESCMALTSDSHLYTNPQ